MLVLYGCNINKIADRETPSWVKADNFENYNMVKNTKKTKKNKKAR